MSGSTEAGGLPSCQIDSTSSDTFTYDGANRLRTATVAGVIETYAYDGDGVRFSRQVGAGPVTRYVSDVNAGLPVTLDDGTRKYVWGLGLAYAVSGTAIEVQHADRLGSIRAVTDGTGTVIATYQTDEFGVPTTSTGSAGSPFRYTGEPLDASGLTYLRARYYDASLGRFLSRDPFAGVASSPLSLNRYSYVHNNPATWSDPSGRILPIFVVLGVAAFNFVLGVVGYVGSNAAVNAIENKPLDEGLNVGDAMTSGVTGIVAGGVGGTLAGAGKRLAFGAAIGCASTLASQQIEPRQDNVEGAAGCAFGAVGAAVPANNVVQSFTFGTITSVAQAVSTFVLQNLGGSEQKSAVLRDIR